MRLINYIVVVVYPANFDVCARVSMFMIYPHYIISKANPKIGIKNLVVSGKGKPTQDFIYLHYILLHINLRIFHLSPQTLLYILYTNLKLLLINKDETFSVRY